MNAIKPAFIVALFCGFFFKGVFTLLNAQDSSGYTEEEVREGRELFLGQTRFKNGGPSCISCHTINDPELPVSGGTYSINITGFGGLNHDALAERILDSPYPHMVVMNAAFKNNPITEEESDRLIAYIKEIASAGAATVEPPLFGTNFLWTGLAGLALFFGLLWLMWRKRKKGSVNDPIYQRQVQSE